MAEGLGGNLRPCQTCGEHRRTTRAGGEGGPWLCAACFLSHNPVGVGGILTQAAAAHSGGPLSAAARGGQQRGGRQRSSVSGQEASPAGFGNSSRGGGLSASSSALPDAGSAGSSLASKLASRAAHRGDSPEARHEKVIIPPKRPDRSLTVQGVVDPEAGGSRMQMLRRAQSAATLPPGGADGRGGEYQVLPEPYRAKIKDSRRSLAKIVQETPLILPDDRREDPRDAEKRREREGRENEERRRRMEGALPQVPRLSSVAQLGEVVDWVQQSRSIAGNLPEVASPKTPAAPSSAFLLPLQCDADEPPLAGGFRRGESVKSLISRERRGCGNTPKIMDLGHEGTVIAAVMAHACAQREAEKHDVMLLIQFKVGFDWLLSPHQICTPVDYPGRTAAGLPGGFAWGDRVRSLAERLCNPETRRGISLGDTGTVIGPGPTPGKVAVRFDDSAGEWNVWPAALCKAEGYELALVAELPGRFRRGDRVRAKAPASARASGSSSCLQEGHDGVVLGPGHASGRVLVRFEHSGQTWSMLPSQIIADTRPRSKDKVSGRRRTTKEESKKDVEQEAVKKPLQDLLNVKVSQPVELDRKKSRSKSSNNGSEVQEPSPSKGGSKYSSRSKSSEVVPDAREAGEAVKMGLTDFVKAATALPLV